MSRLEDNLLFTYLPFKMKGAVNSNLKYELICFYIKSDFSFKSANLTTFPTSFLEIRNDDMNDHRKFSLFITSSNYMIRKNILKLKISIGINSDNRLSFFLSFRLDNHEILTNMC